MSLRVSIITPTYNSRNFIEDTILSILNQTYINWELIITDDCSTDDTWVMLQKYAQEDDRIKLFQLKQNSGAGVARNNSIKYASGRLIAFCDSDDIWLSEKLEKQISFMVENNVALSYSSYQTINETGDDLRQQIITPALKLDYRAMLKENQIGCLTAIYDQRMLGKCYMPLIRKRQDYGLWLSILKKTPYAYRSPGVLAKYRIRTQSVSSSKIGLLKYNFNLFYRHEKLSLAKSLYYVGWNIFRKFKNRRRSKHISFD